VIIIVLYTIRMSSLLKADFVPVVDKVKNLTSLVLLSLLLFSIFILHNNMASFRSAPRSLARPVIEKSTLLICDIQEKFRTLIHNMPTVIHKSEYLNYVCHVLGVPCVITEQYPKALGATVSEITRYSNTKIFAKTQFSMIIPEISAEFLTHRKQVYLDRLLHILPS